MQLLFVGAAVVVDHEIGVHLQPVVVLLGLGGCGGDETGPGPAQLHDLCGQDGPVKLLDLDLDLEADLGVDTVKQAEVFAEVREAYDIVDSATGLVNTSYTPGFDLDSNTEHFWRVRGLKPTTPWSKTRTMKVVLSPPVLVAPCPPWPPVAGGWSSVASGNEWSCSAPNTSS